MRIRILILSFALIFGSMGCVVPITAILGVVSVVGAGANQYLNLQAKGTDFEIRKAELELKKKKFEFEVKKEMMTLEELKLRQE